MKRYEKYMDSGVEWIGYIPEHWNVTRIKYLTLEANSLFIDGDWIESNVIIEDGIKYITTGNVKAGFYSEQGTGFISEDTFKELNCTEVFEGDLIISRLNNPIGRACIVPNLNSRIVTSVDNVILRPDSYVNKNYLLFLFTSKKYFEHTDLIARGATMQRISRGLLGNIKIPLPDLNEQTLIANYLDHKTSQIDSLIAKKERLIELLQEERTAIINQAVTKGLNPNVPMKNSGIEWLGEIPEHWEVKRIKYIGKIISGYSFKSDDFTQKGIRVMKISNIQTMRVDWTDDSYLPEEFLIEYERFKINKGDLVFALTRPIISTGIKATIVIEQENILLNQRNAVLKPSAKLNVLWMYYMIFNERFKEHFESLIDGTGQQPNISSNDIANINIPLPSIEEQNKIVTFLDNKTEEIEIIISKTQQEIELLNEYKKALISEVVTGKIDVRGEVLN